MKLLLLLILFSCQKKQIISKPTYIGSNKCIDCHSTQFNEWKESHHFFSMNEASPKYVKGNFNTTFTYDKIKYIFSKKDNNYFITADDENGKMKKYPVKYTFGVEPLQQYLIPTESGKLHAFNIAWDTKKKKWFHLYPKEKVDHKSPFHWTANNHNWNNRCAECHSTNLQKNFQDDTYHTTFSEINVSCESCHGPASNHLEWVGNKEIPHKGLQVDLNDRGVWEKQVGTTLRRKDNFKHGSQIETCANCHSLRKKLKQETIGENYLDAFHPRFIEPGRYFPDGQIKEEVYVYNSFIQSKMYHEGVVCTDCHKPHNLKLRAEGNALCFRCHTLDNYASNHHGHKPKSKGAQCVNCHMPERTYMVNDPRRDHKFVIPRPDIAGIPNACINCHSDKKWVLEKFTKLWPKLKTQDDYEITFIKAMKGTPGIGKDILFLIKNSLVPSIIRASSVKLTANYPLIMNQALEFALKDSDSLINLAALEMVPNSAQYTESIKKLLQSPHRLIRSQAAFILNKDLGEYLDSLNFNIDDYSSLINLGNLNVANKEFDLAHKNFDQAIKINPHNIPAYVNKADLYRAQGQDDRAEKVLKKGLSIINSGETHMALGLLYVRKKDSEKALNHFEKSYKANSDNFRSLYMYALALDSYGNPNKALKLLESNYEKFSEQPTYHQLLIGICKKSGLSKKVDRYYAKFEEIVKNNR